MIGDYSFDRKLKCGDILEFGDMAIYSMVKNNTFNGMALPDIVLLELIRGFPADQKIRIPGFQNKTVIKQDYPFSS